MELAIRAPSTPDSGRTGRRSAHLDGLVRPPLDFGPRVDQRLHAGRVNVRADKGTTVLSWRFPRKEERIKLTL